MRSSILLVLGLLSLPALAEEKEILRCTPVPGQERPAPEQAQFLSIDRKFYLRYGFEGKTYTTKLDAVSQSEYMGVEGDLLLFFEIFPESRFLFSLLQAESLEYLLGPVYLDCEDRR